MTDLAQHFEGLDNLFTTSGRLKTFANWPFNEEDNCSVTNMAAAGFYLVGGKDEPDLVECFICQKQLDGWEPEDDPWTVHKPDCLYISFGVKNEMDLTIRQCSELLKVFKIGRIETLVSEEMSKLMEAEAKGCELIKEMQKDTGSRRTKKSTS